MNRKPLLQILAVTCFVTMLGAYVVYAHRRAQPPELVTPAAPRAATSTKDQPTNAGGMAAVEPGPAAAQARPAAEDLSYGGFLPTEGAWVQSSAARPDGSTVTTRVMQERATSLAPSSKVLINVFSRVSDAKTGKGEGKEEVVERLPVPPTAAPVQLPSGLWARPETIHHGQPVQSVIVLPSEPGNAPAAAAPIAPSPIHAPATEAAPARTMIFSPKSAPVFPAGLQPVTPPVPSGAPVPEAPRPRPIIMSAKSAPVFPAGLQPALTPAMREALAGDRPIVPTTPAVPPRTAAPSQTPAPAQLPGDITPVAPTAPRSILIPGSKSIDVLLFQQGPPQKPAAAPAKPNGKEQP